MNYHAWGVFFTPFSACWPGLCQIAACIMTFAGKEPLVGAEGDPKPEFCTYINPGDRVQFDKVCVDVHGITKEKVKDAEDFPTVWKRLVTWIMYWQLSPRAGPILEGQRRRVVLVAHNGKVCVHIIIHVSMQQRWGQGATGLVRRSHCMCYMLGLYSDPVCCECSLFPTFTLCTPFAPIGVRL